MADQADPLLVLLAKSKRPRAVVYCAAYVRRMLPSMEKKKAGGVLPRLTVAEQDLVWHMENGYQLETDTLGRDPVLRCLKGHEVFSPRMRQSQYD